MENKTTDKTERQRLLPKAITPQQFEQMVKVGIPASAKQEKIIHRNLMVIYLMYECGLRVGEVSRIKDINFDVDNNVIYILQGKGKKDRIVPMTPNVKYLYEKMKTYKTSNLITHPYTIFSATNLKSGNPMSEVSLWKIVRKVCEKAGVTLSDGSTPSPHALRHGFATKELNKPNSDKSKLNLVEIQQIMGHASIATTAIYTEIAMEQTVKKMMKNKKNSEIKKLVPERRGRKKSFKPEVAQQRADNRNSLKYRKNVIEQREREALKEEVLKGIAEDQILNEKRRLMKLKRQKQQLDRPRKEREQKPLAQETLDKKRAGLALSTAFRGL